jgi:hypothetical protein
MLLDCLLQHCHHWDNIFYSILSLLAIWFFPFITYLLIFNVPLKNENDDFLGIYFFMNFQFNFLIQYQKPQLCDAQKF